MRLGWLAMGSFIVLAGVAGCGRESPPRAPTSSAAVVGTVRVPAGTMFTVRMVDALSTDSAVAGRTFTARLREPLFAPNGAPIAPAGGIVTGRIVAVHRGEQPRLALSFDTLETYEGVVAIDVRLDPPMSTPLILGQQRRADEYDADVVLRPMPSEASGGGPRAEDTRRARVNVASDIELELVLTSPLIVERTR